jgi:hypothetical protein
MKVLSLLFLFFISFNSEAEVVPLCKKFEKEILVKGITETPTALQPYRFIKDEKIALTYIAQYDVKKLGLNNSDDIKKKKLDFYSANNCPTEEKIEEKFQDCSSSYLIPNRNFLLGLLYGMKHHGWSKETNKKAEEKVWSYVHETLKTPVFINLLIVTSMIQEAVEAEVIKNIDLKALSNFKMEFNEETRKHSKILVDKTFNKSDAERCVITTKHHLEEDKIAKTFGNKFAKIIAGWKKP